MARTEWKDEYSVNITELDEQHKHLVETLNTLQEAVEAGRESDTLEDSILVLMDYAVEHFSSEELLMAQHGYPAYEEHRAQHEDFMEKVGGYRERLNKGEPSLPKEIVDFLLAWLLDHILVTDKQYSAFLNDKGVR